MKSSLALTCLVGSDPFRSRDVRGRSLALDGVLVGLVGRRRLFLVRRTPCKMSGPGGFSMNLSRAGTKPNSLGLQGAAGLQRKPAGSAPTPISSLSLPKKKPGGLAKPMAPAAGFGGDDDSGDDLDDDAAERKRMLQRGGMGGGGFAGSAASRAAIEQAKREALEQDASAFDYDGVYDSMQQERSALRLSSASAGKPKKEEKKAHYIGAIMAAHEVRKVENDKLYERKMHKEAEAEAHLYGDKARFMTSAYKRKLSERDEYEAELRRREAEDEKNDVTKKSGLGDFYSNLMNGKMGVEGERRAGGDGDTSGRRRRGASDDGKGPW